MAELRVVVSGTGKMGRQVGAAVASEPGLSLVGFVDGLATTADLDGLPVYTNPAFCFDETRPDVVVDFTNAAWTPGLAAAALSAGVRPVIGTTGLSAELLAWLEHECRSLKTGAVVAPNFAIGAVLMMHFARQAARFFTSAEIIELHHDQKADAPSGTAKATAEMMAAAREEAFRHAPTEKETVPGTRGGQVGGIAIHSVRLPGLVAHQEVIFGAPGQTLTIRHDSTGRDSFMPGIIAAVRAVTEVDRLVVGLDRLFGLAE
ncbi:MAG: 4-hydroxy-tetrahydrodipicolinate reductase [Dehalococcoidia bacterium]|nr:4-hydroxy-tetrahydrodipicolinate reductase [Dehalococcoidia bacterium]